MLWPEGKVPNVQTNACYDPFAVWHEPVKRTSDAVLIVCSGGGYGGSSLEGFEVAPLRDYFLNKGMSVISLKYRCPRPIGLPKHLLAWQDAQRAVRLVRARTSARGLNPEKIGFAGFSAGGHLALMVATSSQTPAYEPVDEVDAVPCHVNWAVPVYPAYGLEPEAESWDVAGCDDLAAPIVREFAFDSKTPPMCFFHGEKDICSPMISLRLYHKLRMMGVSAELHLLSAETHCFMKAAYSGTGAATWKDRVWEWLYVQGFSSVHPNTRAAGWTGHLTSHWNGKVSDAADCETGTWGVSDNNGFRALKEGPLSLRGAFGDCVIDFEYRMSAGAETALTVRGQTIALPAGKGEGVWQRVSLWYFDGTWRMAVDGKMVADGAVVAKTKKGPIVFCGKRKESSFLAIRNVYTRELNDDFELPFLNKQERRKR